MHIRSCDHCLHLYLRTHARNEVYKHKCTRVDSEVRDIEEMFALKQFRGGLAAVSAGPRLTRFLRLPPNPSDVLLQRYDLLPRDRNYMQAIEKNEFHEVDSIEAVISQMLYIEAVISLRCYI